MAHRAKNVANTLIQIASEHGEKVTVMKLIKLVYLAHGWNLGLGRGPLIDEQVEAWQYGPVIRSVYHEFKHHGNSEFDEKSPTVFGESVELEKSDPDYPLLQRIWEVYGQYTGIQLSNITHQPNTPWSQTYTPDIPKGTDINQQLIQDHFEALASQ